jgi:hypothetical protein
MKDYKYELFVNWDKGDPLNITQNILVYVLYSLIKATCFDPLKGSSSGRG